MEDIISGGLTFCGHPFELKTPTVFKWVTVLDLPYGIPDGEIKTALTKFGQFAHIKQEAYMGLYTGTCLVKMNVKTAIPSRITIAGHVCTVFYRGQVRSCFRCGTSGHKAKKCPQRPSSSSGGNKPRTENSDPTPDPTPDPPGDQAPQAGTTTPTTSSRPAIADTEPEKMVTTPPSALTPLRM